VSLSLMYTQESVGFVSTFRGLRFCIHRPIYGTKRLEQEDFFAFIVWVDIMLIRAKIQGRNINLNPCKCWVLLRKIKVCFIEILWGMVAWFCNNIECTCECTSICTVFPSPLLAEEWHDRINLARYKLCIWCCLAAVVQEKSSRVETTDSHWCLLLRVLCY
jgi:hypothetical protein